MLDYFLFIEKEEKEAREREEGNKQEPKKVLVYLYTLCTDFSNRAIFNGVSQDQNQSNDSGFSEITDNQLN